MNDPNKLYLTTDYPLDKVIYLSSFTIDFLLSGTSYTFNHNLPFTPLVKVTWSTQPDFSIVYDQGSGPISNIPSWPFLPALTLITANSTSITLDYSNPDNITEVYVRVYCFMPSDVNTEVAHTASSADRFTLNTDYNYTKLLSSGVTPYSSTTSSVETIPHGLGYIPQVEAWYEDTAFGGFIRPISSSNLAPDGTSIYEAVYADEDNVYLVRGIIAATTRFHYRIYVDRIL